ncbi:hypothetical protein PV416_34455 [Streptomyces ipomoeae]|jgi:hypothetical protein|uniref:hypothetical protein n=1 Tax=Streptomyces ipomoeae TaxID=103232 RepID=UPI0029A7DD79|nr:hypothetical protein [Streptomyces ipomoeae]MDX2696806.1 hypothetical protein [Streptomyces ipomoeae]MDX2826032.1 hypothetical protein [Streptomyces ipomoeae]MDX2844360.1 hypothetical protein [Streptomyces ipomoeae]MDX2878978.1 hypothetical protein [Streptomyces ipomoeae]
MSDLPSGDPSSAAPPLGTRSVDTLLATAVRGRPEVDSAGEARAVAAFRAAREQGVRTARTRRRDDWRPNPRRRVQLSVRTTLAVLLSSLTLGGVAFAAIDSATHHENGGGQGNERGYGHEEHDRRTGPSSGDPGLPGASDARDARRGTDGDPRKGQNGEDPCGAYENGQTSEKKADAYCAGQPDGTGSEPGSAGDGKERGVGRTAMPDSAGRPEGNDQPGGSGQPSGSGEPGEQGKPSAAGVPSETGVPGKVAKSEARN